MEGLFSTDRLMAAQERLHQCMLELRQSVRGRIAAEMCLFDLCRVEGSTLAALTARVEKLEAMLAGRIPAIQQTVPAALCIRIILSKQQLRRKPSLNSAMCLTKGMAFTPKRRNRSLRRLLRQQKIISPRLNLLKPCL